MVFFMSTSSYHPIADIQDPTQAAEHCLKNFGERDIPIQPVAMAIKMGVMIEHGELGDKTATYHPGSPATGGKNATPAKPTKIVVNTGMPDFRERFAIAHALAHHCLGHGPMTDSRESYHRSNTDQRQLNANLFALSLLLPESEIQRVIEHKIASTMEGLTRLFGVSEAALITQLSHLGFINRTKA